jgi:hypothetical protein
LDLTEKNGLIFGFKKIFVNTKDTQEAWSPHGSSAKNGAVWRPVADLDAKNAIR